MKESFYDAGIKIKFSQTVVTVRKYFVFNISSDSCVLKKVIYLLNYTLKSNFLKKRLSVKKLNFCFLIKEVLFLLLKKRLIFKKFIYPFTV